MGSAAGRSAAGSRPLAARTPPGGLSNSLVGKHGGGVWKVCFSCTDGVLGICFELFLLQHRWQFPVILNSRAREPIAASVLGISYFSVEDVAFL